MIARITRALAVAVMALCAMAVASSAANATSPDPYNTSRGTGQLSANTVLGVSGCDLIDVTGNLSGGRGTISSITVDDCFGPLTDVIDFLGALVTIDLGTTPTSIEVEILGVTVTNFVGGVCLYTGVLRGTGSGSDVHVEGELDLNPDRSRGLFCSDPVDAILDVTFPGLTL